MEFQKQGREAAPSNYYLIRVHRDSTCGVRAELRWAELWVRSEEGELCRKSSELSGAEWPDLPRSCLQRPDTTMWKHTSGPCCRWPWGWEGCPGGWHRWSHPARCLASRHSVLLPGCTPGSGEEEEHRGVCVRWAGPHKHLPLSIAQGTVTPPAPTEKRLCLLTPSRSWQWRTSLPEQKEM